MPPALTAGGEREREREEQDQESEKRRRMRKEAAYANEPVKQRRKRKSLLLMEYAWQRKRGQKSHQTAKLRESQALQGEREREGAI